MWENSMVWENSSALVIPIFITITAGCICFILKWTKDKTKKISNLRFFIQIVAVVAVFMGLIVGPFGSSRWLPLGISPRDRLIGADFFGSQFPDGLSIPILACYYPNGRTVTCPIWQIQAYIFPFWDVGRGYEVFYSTSGLEKLAIVFGMVIGMSIILGRFFCGWLCPFGLYMDLISQLRKVTRVRYRLLPERLNGALNRLRYVFLLFFLVVPFLLGPIESWQWPFSYFLTGPFKPISVLLGPLEPLIITWK